MLKNDPIYFEKIVPSWKYQSNRLKLYGSFMEDKILVRVFASNKKSF